MKNLLVVGSSEPENCSTNFYVLLLRPNGHFNQGHLHSVSMGRRPYLQGNEDKKKILLLEKILPHLFE